MTNAQYAFELQGKLYVLYFGNIAVEKFINMGIADAEAGINETAKLLTNMVYVGIYNYALIKGENMPTYYDCAILVDELFEDPMGEEIQLGITNTYNESRASKSAMERLNNLVGKKKAVTIPDQTGTE